MQIYLPNEVKCAWLLYKIHDGISLQCKYLEKNKSKAKNVHKYVIYGVHRIECVNISMPFRLFLKRNHLIDISFLTSGPPRLRTRLY